MEEITFTDILTHYELKLQETSEGLQDVKNTIKKALAIIESGWKGQAADACRIKLEEINSEINKSASELSEAMAKLSAIGELLADGTTDLV